MAAIVEPGGAAHFAPGVATVGLHNLGPEEPAFVVDASLVLV